MRNKKTLLFVFRLILGGLFIWAGIIKILDPLGFAQDIANYQLFPQTFAFVTAIVLPWIEVLCGVFAITGLFLRSSAALLAGLLVGFLILIFITMIRGIDVKCGCFGSLSHTVDYKLLLTDGLLLFLALSVLFSRRPSPR